MARWHTTEFDLLPERAFQQRGWKGSMTLEGGKGGNPPSPDPNIGIAQRELSELAKEQWNTFKTDIYPEMLRLAQKQEGRADEQFAIDKKLSDFNYDQAIKAYQRYEEGALPAMEKLKADADQFNTEGYREQLAQQVRGDIDTQFENQRQAMAMRRQAYGVDPTSGVAAGQENANAVQQAAITAAAMNQTRQAAKDIGLQKQANIYNMYAGLPAQGNANMGLTLNANQAGLGAGQTAFGNYGQTGAALGSAAGSSMQGWSSVGQIGVGKYNADVNRYRAQTEAEGAAMGGFGSMLGSLGAAWITKSDVRTKQDIVRVGQLANGINLYTFEYRQEFRDECGHGRQLGVLAHEVEQIIPEAVVTGKDGYKMVNYSLVV